MEKSFSEPVVVFAARSTLHYFPGSTGSVKDADGKGSSSLDFRKCRLDPELYNQNIRVYRFSCVYNLGSTIRKSPNCEDCVNSDFVQYFIR